MEHVNFDGVNAIMVRGEKGPEKGLRRPGRIRVLQPMHHET